MRYGFEVIELSRLLAHVSYENYDFSLKICKKILVGINRCNGDEIKPYLEVVSNLFLLNDSYSNHRLEWILGIPILKIERPFVMHNSFPNQGSIQSALKAGVSNSNSIHDDIFEFKSTLFKSSSAVKDSLL